MPGTDKLDKIVDLSHHQDELIDFGNLKIRALLRGDI